MFLGLEAGKNRNAVNGTVPSPDIRKMNTRRIMDKFKFLRACAFFLLMAATSAFLPAQTFTILHKLVNGEGSTSSAGLVQGLDGNLYGTAETGGAFYTDCVGLLPQRIGCGSVFKVTPSGKLTVIHSFSGKDGSFPGSGLLLGPDGNFYGVTQTGGTGGFPGRGGFGTIFKITPAGVFTKLYNFTGFNDGATPQAPLIFGIDGNLYGTTYSNGTSTGLCRPGCGTVFRLAPNGVRLTTLHTFGIVPDGGNPHGSLVQAPNGNFYGTTTYGGASLPNWGTVFSITPSGKYTVLHYFDVANPNDVGDPFGGLILATDGNFYGSAIQGGQNGLGGIYKITPSGEFTLLHSLDDSDTIPEGDLIQASDGKLYGTAVWNGTTYAGSIFQMTLDGTFTILYSLPNIYPLQDASYAPIFQATNGELYGITAEAGLFNKTCPDGCGYIFSLSTGLAPIVEPLPISGKVASAVKILGTNLTGATSVSFNGKAALFTLVSPTEITTTVPAGATTGAVEVVLPSGTLKSNPVFTVRP
jgi:uncharacterized repeat protein (TIGR03803 family)